MKNLNNSIKTGIETNLKNGGNTMKDNFVITEIENNTVNTCNKEEGMVCKTEGRNGTAGALVETFDILADNARECYERKIETKGEVEKYAIDAGEKIFKRTIDSAEVIINNHSNSEIQVEEYITGGEQSVDETQNRIGILDEHKKNNTNNFVKKALAVAIPGTIAVLVVATTEAYKYKKTPWIVKIIKGIMH